MNARLPCKYLLFNKYAKHWLTLFVHSGPTIKDGDTVMAMFTAWLILASSWISEVVPTRTAPRSSCITARTLTMPTNNGPFKPMALLVNLLFQPMVTPLPQPLPDMVKKTRVQVMVTLVHLVTVTPLQAMVNQAMVNQAMDNPTLPLVMVNPTLHPAMANQVMANQAMISQATVNPTPPLAMVNKIPLAMVILSLLVTVLPMMKTPDTAINRIRLL